MALATVRRWVFRNPFLCLALFGFVLAVAWAAAGEAFHEHLAGRFVFGVAALLLRPFSLIATWVDPYLRAAPGWVDAVITMVLAFAPYVLADVAYRWLLCRYGRQPGGAPSPRA